LAVKLPKRERKLVFLRRNLQNVYLLVRKQLENATLRNVSIVPPFSVTNKSYLAVKTICFDGATMDKLTYAALKGLRVIDLSKVTVI